MTSFGINNEGLLVFDYYLEDTDTLDGEDVYNGQNSTLWVNFRQAFADKIKETYQDLRNNKKLTVDKFIDYFITNGSDKWSASVYNEDSEYKYISMLKSDNDASNLYQVRGTGEEHFKYFVENRLSYCDGKWYASDYANDIISLRIYTPSTWSGVEPNANITITPFSNMYAGVRYKANGVLQQARVEKNTPVTFEAPTDEDFIDTETAIYGASEISSLGDLAPLYCGTINVSQANKLVELKIGDGTDGYINNNLKTLSVGTNKLLKKIDVRNCPNLVNPLALSGCPNIEKIYATGSGITGIELSNTGNLKIVQLPDTISNLTLKNQLYIEELSLEGYENVRTLCIEHCPTINEIELLNKCTNVERVRFTGVNWEFEDASSILALGERELKGIDENGINTDHMWIDGTCHIASLNGAEMLQINTMYPYLNITYDSLTTQLVFIGADGTTELCRQTISNGGNGSDPIAAGTIDTPVKDATAQYSYTFAGWSLSSGGAVAANALKNVTADRYVYAAFTATIRKYTVRFYNGSTLLQTVNDVAYGSNVNYVGSTPVKTGTGIVSEDWEFTGWSPAPTNISGETNCYAQYRYTGYTYVGVVERSMDSEYINNTNTIIGNYALYDVAGLINVTFEKATTVGQYAFARNAEIDDSLVSISLPEATSIGYSAFENRISLEKLYIPKVQSIEDRAFYGCSKLSVVDLYDTVTFNGDSIFCKSKLDTLILRGATVQALGSAGTNIFADTPIASGSGHIYVPESLVDSYKAAVGWSDYINQIRAIEDYPEAWKKDDWNTVEYHIEQGDYATYYAVGDTASLDLGSEGVVNMQIVAFDTDDLADGSGKAPITWVAKNAIASTKRMNPSLVDVQTTYAFEEDETSGSNVWKNTNQNKSSTSCNADWSVTIKDAGTLTVKYKVGSETTYDKFTLSVDGTTVADAVSGVIDWTDYAITCDAGQTVNVIATYTKNSNGNQNGDTSYVAFESDSELTIVQNIEGGTIPATEGTGSIGGWEKSELRAYLDDTIKSLISENVRSMIKSVVKYSCGYDTSCKKETDMVTTDAIWIPSSKEIYNDTSYETMGINYNEFFAESKNRVKNNQSGAKCAWHLRSACSKTSHIAITTSDQTSSYSSNTPASVIIGFCT